MCYSFFNFFSAMSYILYLLFEEISFYKNSVETQATVSYIHTYEDSDDHIVYTMYVNYEVDGQKYKDVRVKYNGGVRIYEYSSGDSITIKYLPEDIFTVGLGKFSDLIYIFLCILFAVTLLIDLYFLYFNIKERIKIIYIINKGSKAVAQITAIITDNISNDNSKSSKKNRVIYTISFKVRNVEKCEIIHNTVKIKKIQNCKVDDKLNVYFNKNNTYEYYVDIEHLL